MNACWHVLRSKSRKEEFLRDQLHTRRIETYCPRVRVRAVNPRAQKFKPYFPGYLFLHIDLTQISPSTLQWIPGAGGIVSFGGEPAVVSESLIEIIRKRVGAMEDSMGEEPEGLKQGEAVIVQTGPFEGYEAIFDTCISGSARVRVLLQLLHSRQVAMELPSEQIVRKKQLS